MKATKLSAVLAVVIVAPIWYYLIYFLLKAASAGDLQMFLFWVYVPVGLFVQVLRAIIDSTAPK